MIISLQRATNRRTVVKSRKDCVQTKVQQGEGEKASKRRRSASTAFASLIDLLFTTMSDIALITLILVGLVGSGKVIYLLNPTIFDSQTPSSQLSLKPSKSISPTSNDATKTTLATGVLLKPSLVALCLRACMSLLTDQILMLREYHIVNCVLSNEMRPRVCRQRAHWIRIARQYKASVWVMVFDTPYEVRKRFNTSIYPANARLCSDLFTENQNKYGPPSFHCIQT